MIFTKKDITENNVLFSVDSILRHFAEKYNAFIFQWRVL